MSANNPTDRLPASIGESENLCRLAEEALAGQIARDLLYEISNLLTGVAGAASEIIDLWDAQDLRRVVVTNAEYGRRITELVQAFQESFRSAAAPQDAEFGVDAVTALNRCLSLCQKRITWQSVTVQEDYRDLRRVGGESGLLARMFLQLICETLACMKSGGVLTITGRQAGSAVCVEFIGVKAGNPPMGLNETQRSLTDLANVEASSGLTSALGGPVAVDGLGVAFVRHVVGQLGGSLAIDAPAAGSIRFSLSLPAWKQPDGPRRNFSSPVPPDGPGIVPSEEVRSPLM